MTSFHVIETLYKCTLYDYNWRSN